jgi:O-antigen ligase
MILGAVGVEPGAVARLLVHAIRADHLLYSSPEPETWTMLQMIAGLALFGTAARVASLDRDAPRIAAWAVVASGIVLALATEADVVRQWAREAYGGWFLARYAHGERFSLHLADLNAAGSQYVLAGLAAVALAVADRARRWIWVTAVAVILPALWLTGSRSAALGAILIGASVIPLARRRVWTAERHAGAAVLVLLAIGVAGATIVAARQPGEPGSAMSALRMRSEFLVTSARMFASAPVFGVGIGRYHERSAEFMPASLHAIYPFENAHNYFAQQFAELGVIGGALFVWLVAAGVRGGWKGLTTAASEPASMLALVTGCIGYLLTCVTGHPLLVPEAALPFWAAFGVAAGARTAAAQSTSSDAFGLSRKIVAALVVVLLVAGVAVQARRYARVSTPPGERGFYERETSRDGVPFNWMSSHGIFYVGPQPGFIVIPMRAPDFVSARSKPFKVDVDVGGRHEGSYTIDAAGWNEIRIGLRHRARTPFRRVDLRANQHWTRRRDVGLREADDAPRSVMVGEVRWEAAGGR